MARHRKARKARRSNPKRHRRARRLRSNPRRIRGRRLRRNGRVRVSAKAEAFGLAQQDAGMAIEAKAGRPKRRHLSVRVKKARARRKARNHRLLAAQKSLRKRAKKYKPRSYGRSAALTQARRLGTLRKVKGRTLTKSSVYKAMHLKSNPSIAGLIVAAKVLLPQVGVGAVAMVGVALASQKIAGLITMENNGGVPSLRKAFVDANGAPKTIVKYVPAMTSVGVAGIGYVLADKVAPRFKGAVVIGGLLAAVCQAVAASVDATKPDSLAAKAQRALLGDYTTVGSRSYAESGIFREIGAWNRNVRPRPSADNRSEMAMNGMGAWNRNVRPRPSIDNRSEWSANGLEGLDDTSEFAPGEGGVLAGGMFRGPSTR